MTWKSPWPACSGDLSLLSEAGITGRLHAQAFAWASEDLNSTLHGCLATTLTIHPSISPTPDSGDKGEMLGEAQGAGVTQVTGLGSKFRVLWHPS